MMRAANTGTEWPSGKTMNDDRAKALIERYQRDPDFHHRVDWMMNSGIDVGTLREAADCVEAIQIITKQLEAEQAKRPAFQFVTEDDFTLKLHDAAEQKCRNCVHWLKDDRTDKTKHSIGTCCIDQARTTAAFDAVIDGCDDWEAFPVAKADQCCGTCLHWVMRDKRCAAPVIARMSAGVHWAFGEGCECPEWQRAPQGQIESRRRWHNAEQPGAVACASCDHWRRYGNGFGRCNVHDRDRSAGASCGDWLPVTQAALDDEAKAEAEAQAKRRRCGRCEHRGADGVCDVFLQPVGEDTLRPCQSFVEDIPF